jgi:uncharacterized protein
MADEPRLPGNGFVPGRHMIDAYGNGGFRFADMSHRGSILVLPSGIMAWPVVAGQALTIDDFAPVFNESVSIRNLLIGMGAHSASLPDTIAWRFRELGLVFEAMPTGGAARTYNILLGENRKVAAALIAV